MGRLLLPHSAAAAAGGRRTALRAASQYFFFFAGVGVIFLAVAAGGWFLKQEREDRYKNAQKHKIKRGERGYRTQRRKQCSRIVFWHFSTCVLCGTVVVFAKTRRGFFLGNVLHRLFAKEGRVKCYSVVFSLFFLEIWKMFFTWVGKTFFVVGGGFAYTLGSRSIIYTCFFQGGKGGCVSSFC